MNYNVTAAVKTKTTMRYMVQGLYLCYKNTPRIRENNDIDFSQQWTQHKLWMVLRSTHVIYVWRYTVHSLFNNALWVNTETSTQ